MPKGIPNKKHTGEFKQKVIETMRKEQLSYSETARLFELSGHHRAQDWERIYLEEGPEGLYQNAKLVITRRLHVTLPCLALETPVISIVNLNGTENSSRWAPYSYWVNYISENDCVHSL